MGTTPDQEPGAAYLASCISSMEEALNEYENGGEELPINMVSLCADPLTEPAPEGGAWCEESQTYYEEGESMKVGVSFVITTGGPHAQIETSDEGSSYYFHFWDWYKSDEYRVRITGNDLQVVSRVFDLFFEV